MAKLWMAAELNFHRIRISTETSLVKLSHDLIDLTANIRMTKWKVTTDVGLIRVWISLFVKIIMDGEVEYSFAKTKVFYFTIVYDGKPLSQPFVTNRRIHIDVTRFGQMASFTDRDHFNQDWVWGMDKGIHFIKLCCVVIHPWASCQIRKFAGCACAGNAGNGFPATDFKGNR